MIIAVNHIKKSFDDVEVLSDIHFHAEYLDKIAIVGNNGAGKTTLFKIITGELTPDAGDITYTKNCQIGYLSQNMEINSNNTVFDELLSVFNHLLEIEEKLTKLAEEISKTHSVAASLQYDELRQTFENLKGYQYKSLVKGVLKGLGFDEDIYTKRIKILSGGQKTRIALAKLLLEEPTLLLLDEPTNHLDINSIEWLEGFLKNYKGTVLIISHDRFFLDKVVNKVVQIEFGKSQIYNGNYDDFVVESAKVHEILVKAYEKQQQELNRQKAVIAKLKQFNREKSIKRARSREKALSKIEVLEMPMIDDKPMNLVLAPKVESGKEVLTVRDLGLKFGSKTIFSHINFDVRKGDKIAIVGPNGVGKTSIFRIILEQIQASAGIVTIGTKVHIGYYDQEQKNLNLNNTIMEELQQTYPNLTNGNIRNILAAFLFTGDDVFKQISSLSGGEKGRVSLAKIMLSSANFLLLDEPTNHLDIMSKEVLERAISIYPGTVLYISHDRYFINQTSTKILEMSADSMTLYLGNYDYYLEKKKELSLIRPLNTTNNSSKNETTTINKQNWQKNKELQTDMRKLNTQIAKVELSIERTEQEIDEIDAKLCLPEYYSSFDKHAPLSKRKEGLEKHLIDLYNKLEKLDIELAILKG
ncbi:ABC transporter [Candidatus Epulonipiscioides gigas]|nr:ABC transporter [Epulopiscium sp. SCG-C07WGA-EpuloA2]ONI44620.1 ABC transporter [Epulopiscium sp. SCG-C07WGA-EpuloA2]